jgi:hypothetical protein
VCGDGLSWIDVDRDLEWPADRLITGRLEMTSALARAEVICVKRGYRLLHNASLANTCIAFFKPQVKNHS